MTSRDFIQREFDNADGKSKYCSSIYKDGDGNIFSYGTHYPLLFKVAGLTFRNVAGYSMTTSKHISWCYGFNAIDVELDSDTKYKVLSGAYSDEQKIEMLRRLIVKELKRIENEMDSKRRKDTHTYKFLEYQRTQAMRRLDRINERSMVIA